MSQRNSNPPATAAEPDGALSPACSHGLLGVPSGSINTVNGSDPYIIAALTKIRQAKGVLPAFRRGLMYFDFDTGKIAIARAS